MATVAVNQSQVKFATREKNPNNEDNMIYYSEDFPFEYTAAADGEVNITLDIPIGAKIVQITKEIKPVATALYAYNSATRLLVLDASASMSAGQTLFIIFKQIITS